MAESIAFLCGSGRGDEADPDQLCSFTECGETRERPAAINVLELAGEQDPETILVVDEAIQQLKEQDPKLGDLVYLRFFAGLSIEQTAEVMETSPRSVARHWNFARAWLTKKIEEMMT